MGVESNVFYKSSGSYGERVAQWASLPNWGSLWRCCFLAATADYGEGEVGVNGFFWKVPKKRGGISMKK